MDELLNSEQTNDPAQRAQDEKVPVLPDHGAPVSEVEMPVSTPLFSPTDAGIPDGASAQADAVQRFGPSPRALAQRRALAVLVVVLIMVCAYGVLDGALLNLTGWIRWTLSILLLLALGRLFGAAIKKPLAEREVLLLPQALELRRGGFRRLVVFENIRHLHIVQNAAGRIWSLRLDLEDDSVSLRDVDGLAKIFTAAAQKRPAGVLIEVEELRVDWGEPLPWILSVLGAGIVALVALVV